MENLENSNLFLEGTVEGVLFKNEQNGYIVLELDTGSELVTVVGELGDIEEGEALKVEGKYVNHIKFGAQFQAEYCERRLPSNSVNIEKYLASGAIKGIGPSLAKKIVEVFGDKTLEIMEKEPEKLLSIKGISPKKCKVITEEVRHIFNLRMLMTMLSKYAIKSSYAMRSFKKWGFESIEILQNNPYLLCSYEIELEFHKAEQMAFKLNIEKNSPKRIKAGIAYILSQNALNGHTCLPLDKLSPKVCEYLEITEKEFYNIYNEELSEKNLFEFIKSDRAFVYLEDYYRAESYISGRLAVIRAFSDPHTYDFDKLIDLEQERLKIIYEAKQRDAINEALSKGIMILTGGPGTGKTTTLNAIISLYEHQGLSVMIAAPTGRAAKRISDLTGYNAKTLHRLLEVGFDTNGKMKFIHDEKNPLLCDVMVIDEMSMVDAILFESLLRALKLNCRLIMVGDSDQLPSVGAGNILKDLIESRTLPVVQLKEIFRQAQESTIVTNAHKIVHGEYPELSRKNSDFFFFQRLYPEEIIASIIDLAKVRLPKAYGFSSLDDIQILSPSRKGILGTVELNKRLQAVLNEPSESKHEIKSMIYTFREGDKVMQIKNNYDLIWTKDAEVAAGIFNGDIGKIVSINKRAMEVIVDFEGKICVYPFDLLDQLELAYAITIHKSQGSEFDVVIIPLLGGFDKLYYRNLLYTGVTRAKKLLIIIGSKNKLYQMVDNNRRTLRYTGLKAMLKNEMSNE